MRLQYQLSTVLVQVIQLVLKDLITYLYVVKTQK